MEKLIHPEQLENDKSSYPSLGTLENQLDRIKRREWDCLVVLDGCRWDAMKMLVEKYGLDYEVEKMRTPTGGSTPGWLRRIWNKEVADWSDVTYVTGNPVCQSDKVVHTDSVNDWDENYDFTAGHVGEVVNAAAGGDSMAWDYILGTTRPDELTEIAKDYEPPLVVHYMQPHEPFIGNISLDLHSSNHPILDDTEASGTYNLARQGKVTHELLRAAYLDNLVAVWKYARKLEKVFDKVVYTSDHGEALGPDKWGHVGPDDPRGQIVPWVETWNSSAEDENGGGKEETRKDKQKDKSTRSKTREGKITDSKKWEEEMENLDIGETPF